MVHFLSFYLGGNENTQGPPFLFIAFILLGAFLKLDCKLSKSFTLLEEKEKNHKKLPSPWQPPQCRWRKFRKPFSPQKKLVVSAMPAAFSHVQFPRFPDIHPGHSTRHNCTFLSLSWAILRICERSLVWLWLKVLQLSKLYWSSNNCWLMITFYMSGAVLNV